MDLHVGADIDFARLARRLPDEPRWLETRGMLLSGRCRLIGNADLADGCVLRATDTPLVAVVGRPRPDLIQQAADRSDLCVLVQIDHVDAVSAALLGWQRTTAILHVLRDDHTLKGMLGAADVRLLASDAPLPESLPPGLSSELLVARRWSPVAVTYANGNPASFCYAAWETESLWDVSIDTLESYRGQGLAGAAVACLTEHMHQRGKEPVWGAQDSNETSLRLARKLGFVPVDRLILFATATPSPYFRPGPVSP